MGGMEVDVHVVYSSIYLFIILVPTNLFNYLIIYFNFLLEMPTLIGEETRKASWMGLKGSVFGF